MHYDENENFGDAMARIIKFAFVMIVIMLIYCCVGYFKHKKQLASLSKTECGYFDKKLNIDEGPGRHIYVSYLIIMIDGQERRFVNQVDLSKGYTKQGKNILDISRKLQSGDKVCVTYSLEYLEDITDKVLAKQIPYMIDINFAK